MKSSSSENEIINVGANTFKISFIDNDEDSYFEVRKRDIVGKLIYVEKITMDELKNNRKIKTSDNEDREIVEETIQNMITRLYT